MEEGHLEDPQILGCKAQCHSKVDCGVSHGAVSPRVAGTGWGHGEQRGPEGWAAGTESSCQVGRAAPSSTWRRYGGSRQLRRPLSSRDSCSGFDFSGVRARLRPSPAQRAHQAASQEPARPRLATGAKGEPARIPPPFVLRTHRVMPALATHWDSALPQALRTRAGTAPPLSTFELLCRGKLISAVRTRASHPAVPLHLAQWTPTASVRETFLNAPPLFLTLPGFARMRGRCVFCVPLRHLEKSPYVNSVIA